MSKPKSINQRIDRKINVAFLQFAAMVVLMMINVITASIGVVLIVLRGITIDTAITLTVTIAALAITVWAMRSVWQSIRNVLRIDIALITLECAQRYSPQEAMTVIKVSDMISGIKEIQA